MCPSSHDAIQIASFRSFRPLVYEDCRVVDVSIGLDRRRASVGANQLTVHLAAGGSSLRSIADVELSTLPAAEEELRASLSEPNKSGTIRAAWLSARHTVVVLQGPTKKTALETLGVW